MTHRSGLRAWLAAIGLLLSVPAFAHYPILIGDRPPSLGEHGGQISLTFGRGHLHAPKWEEVQAPDWVRGYTFDGMTMELTDKLRKAGPVYRLDYTSQRVGDTWVVFHIPQAWTDHDRGWSETTVRTLIHHGLARGWETPLGLPLEIVPLNQPYGILAGDSARLQLLANGKPLADTNIYAEKYFRPPLQEPYPPDEIITRTVRTDATGVAAVTLHSPGWWVLFATHETGEQQKDGKSGPTIVQDAVWVYVSPLP
ncbi:MAG: Nickel transport complex NikM subunit transmembrane [Gammaproteobacteria bacterium]|nr:MAG: Nickel transport complex NikM subunit transmembrane [Gammaproteobacteria bacterium]TND06783.1 MAG: Nickel transport complex, NikM subunit, transmembrane [Gammaproteobacteria bacterium]